MTGLPIPAFYRRYVDFYPDREAALEGLKTHNLASWIRQNPHIDLARPYGQGKWNVLQVLRHVLDAERVFQVRALWIARGSSVPQPGFDQDAWAAHYAYLSHPRFLDGLLQEYHHVRLSSLLLAESFAPDAWDRQGIANNIPMTPAFLFQCMAGHERHHIQILENHLPLILK